MLAAGAAAGAAPAVLPSAQRPELGPRAGRL